MLDTRTEIARGMRRVNERKGSSTPQLPAPMLHTNADAPIVTHPADQTVRQRIGKPAPKKKKPFKMKSLSFFLAETEGFEPSMRVLARMLP